MAQDGSSIPKVRDVIDQSHDAKVRRSALSARAMMADAQTDQVFLTYLNDKDDNMRAAAAEGIARTRDSGDVVTVAKAFDGETKTKAKLGDAFALVALGRHESSDNAPLYCLVTQLDSKGYRDVAQAYLIEVARDAAVRKALYPYLQPASTTKEQKTGLAPVLRTSAD